jgi:hypothetical protein
VVAADRLDERAGVRLDGETAAADLTRRRAAAVPAGPAFAAADGEPAVRTDGVFVPARGGWRERKLGVFPKRPRGAPAGAGEWASRALPAPAASSAFAALADCDAFAVTWRAWAAGRGLTDPATVTVIADGAPWIWAAAAAQLPGAKGVLVLKQA